MIRIPDASLLAERACLVTQWRISFSSPHREVLASRVCRRRALTRHRAAVRHVRAAVVQRPGTARPCAALEGTEKTIKHPRERERHTCQVIVERENSTRGTDLASIASRIKRTSKISQFRFARSRRSSRLTRGLIEFNCLKAVCGRRPACPRLNKTGKERVEKRQ